ncbi:tRNA (5-methylaminomethyl-2-thiouridine)(34)-methyltransferase MnmD [Fortiea contorta]|uniref:tRNA (5-methylaminomethyl-2-thiouridine)(34)-methyltransferase MnmD n=1 Tax=Fortiea contorta TaxID=1892405 RepID=UPI00034B3767|nr:MnmC family methyltransferase [Fortiea contorta]
MLDCDDFVPQITADGSFTFTSKEFGESFHSHYGAKQESFLKFVAPTQLAVRAQRPVLRLLDVCYGLGYNTAAALETIWAMNPDCDVEVMGLELNPSVPQAAIVHRMFANWDYQYPEILTQIAFEQQAKGKHLKATLLIGDARSSIKQVHQSGFQADAIFLDPFSPPQCPQLWTVEFIQQVSSCLHLDGILATYSCAAAVRTALLTAGLKIASTPPVGRRTPGTTAVHPRNAVTFDVSISQEEKEHLLTRAAIPYRDPNLNDTADVIVRRREQEQQACALEPTSRWRKRWLIRNSSAD